MYITQAADAPRCNTDGALPLFTLSCCSQSDEPAFCRYFTCTTRLCSFLRQQCSPASRPVVLLSIFLCFRLFIGCFYAVSPFVSVRESVIIRWISCLPNRQSIPERRHNGLKASLQPSVILAFISLPSASLLPPFCLRSAFVLPRIGDHVKCCILQV